MLKHLRTSEAFEQKNLLQKGFTLVELLVVIVILGILAAVVVFAVGGSTESAQTNACKAEISTAAAGVEAYAAKFEGTYPAPAGTRGWDNLLTQDVPNKKLKLLRSAPKNYTLGASGAITPTPALKCVGVTEDS